MDGKFNDEHYPEWRRRRIEKLKQILGPEWFKRKKVLELACGYGYTGVELQSLGADVTFAEGRAEYADAIRENAGPDARIITINQENEWPIDDDEMFDLVVHWGVLYHLKNWQDDVRSALSHCNILTLETEVCDSSEIDEFVVNERALNWPQWDQSISGTGIRPSAAAIEAEFMRHGVTWERFDDADLNCHFHHYDWKVRNTGKWQNGQRRYWIARKQ